LQTNDRPNIQTYALCTFTFSLQTFTIFFRINAFINVYYNFFDVYHIYGLSFFKHLHCADSGQDYHRALQACISIGDGGSVVQGNPGLEQWRRGG